MPSPLRWPDAALAGLASSMRSMSGPATLAARGRITGTPAKAFLVGGAGELVVDKTSMAVDRWTAPGMVGRLGSGGYTGFVIAGPVGAATGLISAGLASYSTWRIRGLVAATTGLPDPVIAAAEDIVAYAAMAAATREHPEDEQLEDRDAEAPARSSLARNAAKGLIAGIAGTTLMTLAQGVEFVLTDAEPSNSPAQVADKASRKLGLGRIKRRDMPAANQGMHWLYGTSWGIPYGILAGGSKTRPEISGPVFGLIVWGAALAHQPALGIADKPWNRSLQSLSSEALFHVVYGLGAGAALRALRNR